MAAKPKQEKLANLVVCKCNKVVDLIRAAKSISFGEVSARLNMAPSTLYAYKKVILSLYPDIEFNDGVFSVKEKA